VAAMRPEARNPSRGRTMRSRNEWDDDVDLENPRGRHRNEDDGARVERARLESLRRNPEMQDRVGRRIANF